MSSTSSPSRPQLDFARTRPRRPAQARPPFLLRLTVGLTLSAATIVAGVFIGLSLTAAALRNGEDVGAATVGVWRLDVGEGTPGINPYQRAVLARTGAVPMTAGQGVAFTAFRDNTGQRLDRRCSYLLGGSVPRARFWTVSVADNDGFAIANDADRSAFTSASVLREEGGRFSIALSPAASPGNWIPLAGQGAFRVDLRLYDSAVPGLSPRELAGLALPIIERTRCT